MEETTGNITYKIDDRYLASRQEFSEFLTQYKEELEADDWQKISASNIFYSKILYTTLHLGHIDPLKYIKGELASNSFLGCRFITSVNIPDSIISLGAYCFSKCISLESITLPDSIKSLEMFCFNECASLESITLPNSITSIGEACFYNCTNLKSITIPDSVTSLGEFCFSGCAGLKTLTCSKNLKFDREKIGLADNVQIIRR